MKVKSIAVRVEQNVNAGNYESYKFSVEQVIQLSKDDFPEKAYKKKIRKEMETFKEEYM